MKKLIYSQVFLFFILFFTLRVSGIFDLSIQADEVHWRLRSLQVLNQISLRNWNYVTSHLGHPGVSPTLVMGFSEWLGKKLGLIGFEIAGIRLDYLHFARLGCILISSMIVIPILVLGKVLFGKKNAFLTCIFILFSASHIGLSRFAHLDAVLTFLVVSTVMLYFVGIVKNNDKSIIYSGIFWGLALSTKPTVVAIPIGLFFWKISLFILKRIPAKKIIQLVDLWFVFIGHIVFSLIYTRFWKHESAYFLRLKIKNIVADYSYSIGMKAHFLWPLFLSLVILQFVVIFRKKSKVTESGLLLLFSFLLFWLAFPYVIENIIRFWIWVVGISDDAHISFGTQKERFPLGYLGIILRDLSPLRCIGLLGGIFLLFKNLYKGGRSDKEFCLLGVLIVFITWTLLLSVSSKQTMRYILPVLIIAYFLISHFYLKLFEYFVQRFSPFSKFKKKILSICCLLILVVPDVLSIARLSPYEARYESDTFGYFFQNYQMPRSTYNFGLNELVKFIYQKMESKHENIYVFGDKDTLDVTKQIVPSGEKEIEFLPYRKTIWGHLFVRFHNYDETFMKFLSEEIGKYPILFSSNFEQMKIISLYREPLPDLNVKKSIPVADFYRNEGVISKNKLKKVFENFKNCPEHMGCVGVKTDRNRKSNILFGLEPYFESGDYVFSTKVFKSLNPNLKNSPVLKISIGQCEKTFYSKDLKESDFQEIEMECHFDSLNSQSLTLYWFDTESIIITDLQVIKKQHTLMQ